MPEPITVAGLGIAAYLGKDTVNKLLGGTAEYLGEELKEFAKKRINTVGKIFKNATGKLGDKINQPGRVPPKVLRTIINEGSYSEEQVSIEYFGGVLASSRSNVLRDDRGARIAKELDNLSYYQLRCHYLIYSTISKIFEGGNNSFSLSKDRAKLKIFMPVKGFINAMELSEKAEDNGPLLSHTFHGLDSDGFIMNDWVGGSLELLKLSNKSMAISGPGIVCTPTAEGAELFLWGFGCGNKELDYIFSQEFNSSIEGMLSFVPGSAATKIE